MNQLQSSIISINPGRATTAEAYMAAHSLPVSEAMPLTVDYAPVSVSEAITNPFRTLFAAALRFGMRLRAMR